MSDEPLNDVLTQDSEAGDTLILGIGNYLLGDEGVGVHVVHALEHEDLPPHVDLLDGGTGGYQLLGQIQKYRHVIVVDASLDTFDDGHIRCITPRFASDFPATLSAHDIGLRELIDVLVLLEVMPRITLVAISISNPGDLSTHLSPPIRRAAAKSIDVIRSLVRL